MEALEEVKEHQKVKRNFEGCLPDLNVEVMGD
jgi:hypothetical protein